MGQDLVAKAQTISVTIRQLSEKLAKTGGLSAADLGELRLQTTGFGAVVSEVGASDPQRVIDGNSLDLFAKLYSATGLFYSAVESVYAAGGGAITLSDNHQQIGAAKLLDQGLQLNANTFRVAANSLAGNPVPFYEMVTLNQDVVNYEGAVTGYALGFSQAGGQQYVGRGGGTVEGGTWAADALLALSTTATVSYSIPAAAATPTFV